MARGVNKVILIGNLGQDPEVRYMPSGGAVANVNIATTEVWSYRQSGQRQERTEWHKVVFFNKLAEVVQQYLKKGSKIYIEGKLQTRKWQDQNGVDCYTTEIVSNDMQMLDGGGPSKAMLHSKMLHSKMLHSRMLHSRMLHSKMLHSKMLHSKMLHSKMLHSKMLHSKMLHSKMLHSIIASQPPVILTTLMMKFLSNQKIREIQRGHLASLFYCYL